MCWVKRATGMQNELLSFIGGLLLFIFAVYLYNDYMNDDNENELSRSADKTEIIDPGQIAEEETIKLDNNESVELAQSKKIDVHEDSSDNEMIGPEEGTGGGAETQEEITPRYEEKRILNRFNNKNNINESVTQIEDDIELSVVENPIVGMIYVDSPYTLKRLCTVCILGSMDDLILQTILLMSRSISWYHSVIGNA
eukprot:UN24441